MAAHIANMEPPDPMATSAALCWVQALMDSVSRMPQPVLAFSVIFFSVHVDIAPGSDDAAADGAAAATADSDASVAVLQQQQILTLQQQQTMMLQQQHL